MGSLYPSASISAPLSIVRFCPAVIFMVPEGALSDPATSILDAWLPAPMVMDPPGAARRLAWGWMVMPAPRKAADVGSGYIGPKETAPPYVIFEGITPALRVRELVPISSSVITTTPEVDGAGEETAPATSPAVADD